MHDYSSDLKGPYENDECHDHEYPATESPYIVGFALESNLALSSEISQCSLHPSMIYSDVEQDDQLNKCTSVEKRMISVVRLASIVRERYQFCSPAKYGFL